MFTKICSDCGAELPLDDFKKDRSTKDGRKYICRKCDYKRYRKYRKACDERYEQKRKLNRISKVKKCIKCGEDIIGLRIKLCVKCRDSNKFESRKRSRKPYYYEEYRFYRKNNHSHILERENKNEQKHIDRLSDRYIKRQLTKRNTLRFMDIDKDLINAYRKVLIIKRIIKKERLNEIEKTC